MDQAEFDKIIAQKDAVIAEQREQIAALIRANERMAHQLARLERQVFGRKAEYIDPNQLPLLDSQGRPVDEEPEQPPEKKRRQRRSRHGRSKLPRNLPTVEVATQVEERTCGRCGGELKTIGEAVSERLDFEPGRFVRHQIIREKCACPNCPSEGVKTAPLPNYALDRTMCGDGLLSHVIVSKFADHVPLNRQHKQFKRTGVTVPVNTMCGWLKSASLLLARLIDGPMKTELMAGDFVQTDTTGMPVLEGDKNHPKKACLWAYGHEDVVIYEVTDTHEGHHAKTFLDGFEGTLLCDGAGTFNEIARTEGIYRAGCWAHCRRYFYDALESDRDRATMAMAFIRKIFEIEREIRDRTPQERVRERQSRTAPILKQFSKWLEQQRATAPPSTPLGRAITYTTNQWKTLQTFLTHGEIPADNNRSERNLRGPVVGRKNWLFAGSEGGAKAAAIYFSIVGSCQLNGIDPWAYLRDVLPRIPDAKLGELHALTPAAWAEANR